MDYARWETIENMKKLVPLTLVDGTKNIKSSGIPMAYDDKNIYVDTRSVHSLIIGTTGSGKTQAITLPMLKLACLAGESVILHGLNNELYKETKDMFKNSNYNIIRLNLDDTLDTNCWNPLWLAKKYYDEGNLDKTSEIIENIGYYLLNEKEEKNSDPFWINSAISFFTGICLYALEKEKEVSLVTIHDISEMVRMNSTDFINKLDKHSLAYIYLSSVLTAPPETRGSIFSVFIDKYKKFIVKNSLRTLLSKNDFDITKISREKTIIYVESGKSNISKNLVPLFINQVYSAKESDSKLNIIIDDFYELNSIKDFSRMLNYSRGLGVNFTIMIRGFNDLKNIYGKEEMEMIRLSFTNLIYLLSQDIETLEEISKICGNKKQNIPLISIEELKTISEFEAIILTTRIMPFRTKLLPYYKMK